MNPFESYLYSRFQASILSFPADIANDIYVFGIQIEFLADDYRKGEVAICHNTQSNFQNSPQAQDPESSKWDWSYWFHAPYLLNICGSNDLHGAELRDRYLEAEGLLVSDEDLLRRKALKTLRHRSGFAKYPEYGQFTVESEAELQALDRRLDFLLTACMQAFIDRCADAVHRIQQEGTVTKICHRDVPVVLFVISGEVDSLENAYAWNQVRRANPTGSAGEYCDWWQGVGDYEISG